MGAQEIDEKGHLKLPLKLRERLKIKPRDKVSIRVDQNNNNITLRKKPLYEEIINKLIGCIKTQHEEKLKPESIKDIWKSEK